MNISMQRSYWMMIPMVVKKNYENFTELFEETEFASENNECENDLSSKDILVFVSFILMLRLSRTQAKEVFDEVNRRRMSLGFFVQSVYVSYRKDNHAQILVSSRNSNAEPRMERIHQRFIVNLVCFPLNFLFVDFGIFFQLSSSCAKSAVQVYIIFGSGSAEESNAFDEISKKEKY
ncbi:Protein CBG06547 [Caenorhabditis briggsae]|uniref:Protein CBG06547 n=1 Tax=Caenorhabditis briggsae TaxID=6238 RepID=A8X2H8_CAEBR|nr:Protein CBG06547 [Caenorhabditis briggsae]CAP26838.1 Protein CBG06547 [Caenorhabditis briggsae]